MNPTKESQMSSKLNKARLNRVVLAVGSNIDPLFNIEQAKATLSQDHNLIDCSEFTQTKPQGFQNQPDFLNGAFYIETSLAQDEFNVYLKGVEIKQDRIKGPIKAGPRTIDLDIIIWNNVVIDDDFYNKFYITDPVTDIIKRQKLSLKFDEVNNF